MFNRFQVSRTNVEALTFFSKKFPNKKVIGFNLNKSDHISLFGAENRLYVHHKLKELNIQEYWKGKFPKNLSPVYEDKSILKDAKYMIDMSIIKGDGGGTQYTFLAAIYHDCALILHKELCQLLSHSAE